jgi:predicted  nucleic acid-binding Zn-ribbon protein
MAYQRQNQIDEILNDNVLIERAEQDVEKTEMHLHKAIKNLKEAEWNVQTQRKKIKQTETKLYSGSVTNPKELQDLQKESNALRRYLDTLEDHQLKAMLELDDAEEANREAHDKLEEIQIKLNKKRTALFSEKNELQKRIYQLKEEREITLSSIPSDDIQLYNQLRDRRGGVAVTKVSNRACAACGSTLTASTYQGARMSTSINCCDSCGRILYAA